jgi:hypothetical protein
VKKRIFSILLVAALVITGTIGATGMSVSAAEENAASISDTVRASANSIRVLSDTEIAYLSNLPDNIVSTKEGYEQAEKYRLEAVRLAEKGIEKLVSQSQLLRLDTVNLGTDRTFYDAGWGVYWSETWGTIDDGNCYSTSYLEQNQDEANIMLMAGAGGAASIAWVGNQFTVSGSGSQQANISMSVDYVGYLDAYAVPGGSVGINIDLVIRDDTTETEYSTEILDYSIGLGSNQWDVSINAGDSLVLQAGHQYTVYLALTASAGISGIGYIVNDWGRFDADTGQYANYSYINIDF